MVLDIKSFLGFYIILNTIQLLFKEIFRFRNLYTHTHTHTHTHTYKMSWEWFNLSIFKMIFKNLLECYMNDNRYIYIISYRANSYNRKKISAYHHLVIFNSLMRAANVFRYPSHNGEKKHYKNILLMDFYTFKKQRDKERKK